MKKKRLSEPKSYELQESAESFLRMLKTSGWRWFVSEVMLRRERLVYATVDALLRDEAVARSRAGITEGIRQVVVDMVESLRKEAEAALAPPEDSKEEDTMDVM